MQQQQPLRRARADQHRRSRLRQPRRRSRTFTTYPGCCPTLDAAVDAFNSYWNEIQWGQRGPRAGNVEDHRRQEDDAERRAGLRCSLPWIAPSTRSASPIRRPRGRSGC